MAQYRHRTLLDHVVRIQDNLKKKLPDVDLENATLKKIVMCVAKQAYEEELELFKIEPLSGDDWEDFSVKN